MKNQMMAHGGLYNTNWLTCLNVGETTNYYNCGFAPNDVQECCDRQIQGMKFMVGATKVEGGSTLTPITRVA